MPIPYFGDDGAAYTCSELTPRGWRPLDLTLSQKRYGPSQWTDRETGNTFIMGGYYYNGIHFTVRSVDMITAENKLVPSPFTMRHDTG